MSGVEAGATTRDVAIRGLGLGVAAIIGWHLSGALRALLTSVLLVAAGDLFTDRIVASLILSSLALADLVARALLLWWMIRLSLAPPDETPRGWAAPAVLIAAGLGAVVVEVAAPWLGSYWSARLGVETLASLGIAHSISALILGLGQPLLLAAALVYAVASWRAHSGAVSSS